MTRPFTKKLFVAPLAFLCALALTACTDNEAIDITSGNLPAGEVIITVIIPGTQVPVTRSIAGGNGEATVDNIDILVFGGSATGLLEHASGTIVGQSQNGGEGYKVTFRARLASNDAATSVAILTNVPEATIADAKTKGSKDNVLKALTYATNNPGGTSDGWKWNTNDGNYSRIPMYGEISVVGITAGMNMETVELTRMLARVDVVNNATADFELQEVYVVNYNTAGYIAPAWGADGTPLTAPAGPMIPPTANPQLGTAKAMTYTYANYNSGAGMYGEIYTYEALATTGGEGSGHTAAACLIVKGTYKEKTYFYRIDFTAGTDAAGRTEGDENFDPSTVDYMPLYRNHRYEVIISAVQGIGYDDADAALKSLGIMNNLKTELLVLDESGIVSTVFNGQYYLGIGKEVVFNYIEGETAEVLCTTNYVDGWEVDYIEVIGDTKWLKADKDPLATNIKTANLQCKTLLNSETSFDYVAYVHLKAGRLRHKLKVTQKKNPECYPKPHSGWAGSNIYYDEQEERLAFDDVGIADHKKYGGLYFQWGSLYGISPVGAWDGNNLIYPPNGTPYSAKTNGFSSIWEGNSWMPRVRDVNIISYPPTGKELRDRAYLYEITDGSTGLGDICKYMTELGWVPEGSKWRMPTSSEFSAITDYSEDWIDNGSGIAKADGTGVFSNGRERTDSDPPVFFPASGYRSETNGSLNEEGDIVYYWSGTSNKTFSHCALFKVPKPSSTSISLLFLNYRACSCPVRCVRE